MSHDHNHSHDHGHSHGHGHHDHSHAISADADRRYLFTALGLLVGFMVVEVVVGLIAQSLALITDAGAIGGACVVKWLCGGLLMVVV